MTAPPPEPQPSLGDKTVSDNIQSTSEWNSTPSVKRDKQKAFKAEWSILSVSPRLPIVDSVTSGHGCPMASVCPRLILRTVSLCIRHHLMPSIALNSIPMWPLGVSSASHFSNHCHWIALHSTGWHNTPMIRHEGHQLLHGCQARQKSQGPDCNLINSCLRLMAVLKKFSFASVSFYPIWCKHKLNEMKKCFKTDFLLHTDKNIAHPEIKQDIICSRCCCNNPPFHPSSSTCAS